MEDDNEDMWESGIDGWHPIKYTNNRCCEMICEEKEEDEEEKYEDGNYNIESITCEGYQSLTKLQNVFPKETEQNIIRDIITYPWNKNINQKFIQYAGGSISKKKHIKTVKNNKEYIEVIAIKDDDKWWYTITWNTDINKTHKFCVSSDTVPGNNNSQKIKHIISSINNKT